MKQKCLMLGAGSAPPKRKLTDPQFSASEEETEWVTLDIMERNKPDILFDLNWIERTDMTVATHGLRDGYLCNQIPVPDETFDEIHAYEVMEHYGKQGDWEGFFQGMKELWRILKPGGMLIGTVPKYTSEWAWGDPGHTRVITKGTLSFLMKASYENKSSNEPRTDYQDYVDPCWWEPRHGADLGEHYSFGIRKPIGELSLQIETGSTCNAACNFCVYPEAAKERSGKKMRRHTFEDIIDDAEVLGVGKVVLNGLNEPLLDPDLESKIEYVRAKMPRAFIEIYSNGLLMTPRRFDSLADAGLSGVVFSLNAVTPRQHEEIMGMKGKFDLIEGHIDYARENKKGVTVEVHAVMNPDYFDHSDEMSFYHRWGHYNEPNGVGAVIREGNWANELDAIKKFSPNEKCGRATNQMYITYDGRVTTCCFDPFGRQVFGNVEKESLKVIRDSEEYVAFRKAHEEDRADEYDICRNCTRI